MTGGGPYELDLGVFAIFGFYEVQAAFGGVLPCG